MKVLSAPVASSAPVIQSGSQGIAPSSLQAPKSAPIESNQTSSSSPEQKHEEDDKNILQNIKALSEKLKDKSLYSKLQKTVQFHQQELPKDGSDQKKLGKLIETKGSEKMNVSQEGTNDKGEKTLHQEVEKQIDLQEPEQSSEPKSMLQKELGRRKSFVEPVHGSVVQKMVRDFKTSDAKMRSDQAPLSS